MAEVFHKGEIEVQKLAGVEQMASRIGGMVKSDIHPVAQNFLKNQPFIVATSVDKNGNVWASMLVGEVGFIKILDEMTIEINAENIEKDILFENLKSNNQIGILGIEFSTRLRMRLNGEANFEDKKIIVHAKEVFSNCPKYIQARAWDKKESSQPNKVISKNTESLNQQQKDTISNADTFFIATRHIEKGADASHRGGNPGFVKVSGDSTIIFPDYSGNMMFQTLGNIQINPNAGLLFVDFENGNTLQLSGKAKIIWDETIYSQFAGAERAVEFQIEKIIETTSNVPFSWDFQEYSPVNP